MAGGVIEAHKANENPWALKHGTNNNTGKYSVYIGTDPVSGEVKYVGMTNR